MAGWRHKLKLLLRRGFVRPVLVLVGGTASAQMLMLLALPLLTRLYSPDDFRILAIYASALGIVSVVACLRLEIAIPLPLSDKDAACLLALALCSSAAVGGILTLIVALLTRWPLAILGEQRLHSYLWLLPVGVWLASSYAALQYWATRRKRFSAIAKTRLAQAIGGVTTQGGLGWLGIAPLGLVVGHMISSGAGTVALARDAFAYDRASLGTVKWGEMRRLFVEYQRFPRYSTLEALANNIGIYLPVIAIAIFALGPEAGYLMLATRAMQAPVGLIGGAVAQVYLSRAPEELRMGTIGKFTADALGGLIKTGVGPILFSGIVAPPLFIIFFGSQWVRAGAIVSWMTPWLILQFISSPISMIMHVRSRQAHMLALTTTGLALRVGATALAGYCARSYLSEFYAISGAVFYLICFLTFLKAAEVSLKDVLFRFRGAAAIVLGWAGLGVAVRYTLEYMVL